MNPQVMHDYIIYPTLQAMTAYTGTDYNSKAARQLLLITAGQESHCGDYLTQVKGPALGPYQMEPNTTNDLYKNYLTGERLALVMKFMSPAEHEEAIVIAGVGNLFYCTALARMNYRRVKAAVPAFDDQQAMWEYYKKYWNSVLGAATQKDFNQNWERFVTPTDFSDPTARIQKSTGVL